MTLGRERAQALVQAFTGCRVVVVGDVMLDQFLFGRVQRLSPEAPVPIVEYTHDDYRPGGAANVAMNLAALAAIVAMLAAGFFEYNFGDSEFLMMFLVLVTLPFAAARSEEAPTAAA